MIILWMVIPHLWKTRGLTLKISQTKNNKQELSKDEFLQTNKEGNKNVWATFRISVHFAHLYSEVSYPCLVVKVKGFFMKVFRV